MEMYPWWRSRRRRTKLAMFEAFSRSVERLEWCRSIIVVQIIDILGPNAWGRKLLWPLQCIFMAVGKWLLLSGIDYRFRGILCDNISRLGPTDAFGFGRSSSCSCEKRSSSICTTLWKTFHGGSGTYISFPLNSSDHRSYCIIDEYIWWSTAPIRGHRAISCRCRWGRGGVLGYSFFYLAHAIFTSIFMPIAKYTRVI